MDRKPLRVGVMHLELVLARVDEIGLLDHAVSEERFGEGQGFGWLHDRLSQDEPPVVHRLFRLLLGPLESHDPTKELRVGSPNDRITKAHAGILRLA